MSTTSVLYADIPAQLKQKLRQLAYSNKRTLSDHVIWVLTEHVASQQNVPKLPAAAGKAGPLPFTIDSARDAILRTLRHAPGIGYQSLISQIQESDPTIGSRALRTAREQLQTEGHLIYRRDGGRTVLELTASAPRVKHNPVPPR
jgi:hypothetical protein